MFCQNNAIQLSIYPKVDSKILVLSDSAFHANDSNNLQIESLKFYISNIRFLKNNELVLKEKNSFHLINAANEKSSHLLIDNKQNVVCDEVQFDLGIDSTTNVSGAFGGDLDPTLGMYWTWQSGYINFKIEGKSKQCKTRNSEFQLHLGGYQAPYNCLQTVSLAINEVSPIEIKLDVGKILNQMNLATKNHIMSPCTEAVSFSKIVANSFTVSKK